MISLLMIAAMATTGAQLYCHRTANQDAPENTLLSLQYAALAGCNVVEIDIRRTLDGVLVLNHDGILERLTDGSGEIEQTTYAELQLLDAGSWMSSRFAGQKIARFEDALRLAHALNIQLILDIKIPSTRPEVMKAVDQNGLAELIYTPYEGSNAWVEPGVTTAQVAALHAQGKKVIANFSANGHEMDLAGMKAAVAAGVDAINVDYPRLGAEAVGRSLEAKWRPLLDQAAQGSDEQRAVAVAALARYEDPDLEPQFLHLLATPLPLTSRAAAVALVPLHPQVPPSLLHSQHAVVRANTAWLLGMLHASATELRPLLEDKDVAVQREALLALSRATGTASREMIVRFLDSPNPALRGPAALALAHLHPVNSAPVILAHLQQEITKEKGLARSYAETGHKKISHEQIHAAMTSFRTQMEMVHALGSTEALADVAFHPLHEFAQTDGIVAGFQLWERAADSPTPIVEALASTDPVIANRAEWALVKADLRVLPAVRAALNAPTTRTRAIRILAWHGDAEALPALQAIAKIPGPDQEQAAWAIEKIHLLSPDR
jgi:glycerophosphoryl diester phosphodiesterase